MRTATDISADGTTVVGFRTKDAEINTFYWTEETGIVVLEHLAGIEYLEERYTDRATSVSNDGRVIVGKSWEHTAAGFTGHVFVWTQNDGMRALRDVLIERGATGLVGWTVEEGRVSGDGNVSLKSRTSLHQGNRISRI